MTVSLAARWQGGFRPRRIFWCCVRAQRENQIHSMGSQETFAAFAPEHKQYFALNVRFPLEAYPISHTQRTSAFLKVFRCGPGCNFAVRGCVRPALTNLGRRKPRGSGIRLWGKSVGGWGCHCHGRAVDWVGYACCSQFPPPWSRAFCRVDAIRVVILDDGRKRFRPISQR